MNQASVSRETLIATLQAHPDKTREQLAKVLQVPSEAIRDLLRGLKAERAVVLSGDRRGSTYRWVAGSTQETPEMAQIDHPRLCINKRFAMMTKLVKAMVQGQNNSMIILGQGGTGKTSSVMGALEELGMEPAHASRAADKVVLNEKWQYLHIKGVASATEVYRVLFENSSSLILFDDCDSVLEDGNGMNVLKAALDTFEVRQITWVSSYVQKTMALPESFEFKGKVIFITNKPKVNQALQSRSLIVDLNMTKEELCDRMGEIGRRMNEEISENEHNELIDFLRENAYKFADFSLRTYMKVANLIVAGETDWRDLALWSN